MDLYTISSNEYDSFGEDEFGGKGTYLAENEVYFWLHLAASSRMFSSEGRRWCLDDAEDGAVAQEVIWKGLAGHFRDFPVLSMKEGDTEMEEAAILFY